MLFRALIIFALGAQLVGSGCAKELSTSYVPDFKVVTVVEGLNTPWGMAFLPNGDILVTERPGNLRLVRKGELLEEKISGLPEIKAIGQGGLLDVALHPDYEKTGWIYLSYSAADEEGKVGTELARARLKNLRLVDLEILFVAEPKVKSSGVHFGSRIVFDNEGFLFLGLGDRGQKQKAQELNNHLGSLIRLHDDGTIPESNPGFTVESVRSEIYSYGHRNIQGAVYDPAIDKLWLHEHGPKGGDEVNLSKIGGNYGWPTITYGINYNGTPITEYTEFPGMEQPVIYWVPSIAPCGMAQYRGDDFPEWKGDLFVGALAGQHLRWLDVEGEKIVAQHILLEKEVGRIRNVVMGPDGFLYLSTDGANGKILRLEPEERPEE